MAAYLVDYTVILYTVFPNQSLSDKFIAADNKVKRN